MLYYGEVALLDLRGGGADSGEHQLRTPRLVREFAVGSMMTQRWLGMKPRSCDPAAALMKLNGMISTMKGPSASARATARTMQPASGRDW